MTVQAWIQFGALFVAILALVFQQYRVYQQQKEANRLTELMDLRTETKLQIFYILQKDHLSEEEIIKELGQRNPTVQIDVQETRKALYEMLQDETVRLMGDNKYRPRIRSARPTY
jgi:DNA-directed RNA polymerase specialized sigma24 family protein